MSPAYLGNPHDHPIWEELSDALDEAMTKWPPMQRGSGTMTDETRVLAPDPQDRWRLVRVGTEFLTQFGTRTDDGRKLVATWGEPDDLGVYEPTFTATDDGMTLVPTATLERARRIEEKARAVALDCIRMFWGARRPCDEYTDGRELCAPCALRAALEDDR